MAVYIPNKLVYLAHTRVASNATVNALGQIGAIYIDTGEWGGGTGHHAVFPEIIKHFPFDDELRVSTVRNHYDALVTWWIRYTQKGKGNPDFLEFLKDKVADSPFVKDNRLYNRHLPYTDHVLRYENLQADLDALLLSLALPKVELQAINVTLGKQNYATYYTPAIKDFVDDIFGDEIQELGYCFEGSITSLNVNT